MEQHTYLKKHEWLLRYLECAAYEVPVWVSERMKRRGISLIEIHQVVAGGEVLYVDEDYGGCHFAIGGSNCDDENIKVSGWFDPSLCVFTVIDIDKSEG